MSGETVYATTGNHIGVYWLLDDAIYPGKISDANELRVEVLYDDGDKENLDLRHKTWRFASSPVAATLSAELPSLGSNFQEDLVAYFNTFGNKPFMQHQAQVLQSHVLYTAYCAEEESFKKQISVIARSELPPGANLICSHVIYKIKVEDDGMLKMKARFAPPSSVMKTRSRRSCAQTALPVHLQVYAYSSLFVSYTNRYR